MSAKKHPLAILLLSFVLALTGFQAAAARGTPPPVGEIVICAGQGLVTISVDADGNPTGPVHICPDAALCFFAAVTTALPRPVPASVWHRMGPRIEVTVAHGRATPTPQARDPPRTI